MAVTTKSLSRRGPYAKGVARRAEILDAALRLYGESSGERPTLAAIAADVGLTEAGVLHYFGSMNELFVAILEARDVHAVDDGVLSDPDHVWAYLTETTRTPGLTKLFVDMSVAASDPHHPAHAFMERHRQRVHEVVKTALQIDDEQAIRLAVAAAEGLQMRWIQNPDTDIVGDLEALARVLTTRSVVSKETLPKASDDLESQ
ncbi:TetR/AcrR family transcriptional regulator [Cutibacterium sp. WCA-380-WT-3A]|uniref:TetR/AcrR family transcriptional regulator n=1 Tax=Cutibacterium porci TaxID=2605781 RepID=A0A7K0J6M0_9ACTN|nr:TetR/AcrR family transcriptional regulator [Cutibacterium porci]MSS45616.1 TetR/AcrR family transcriptional regulator [Cutibacterium porci]